MSGVTDLENYWKGQTHNVGATPANTQLAVTSQLRKRRIAILRTSGTLGTNTDDAMASTTTAEQQLMYCSVAGTVTAFVYIPNGTVTADATNNAVLTLSKRTAAGGTQTTVATITTDLTLGNLVAGQGAVGTLTATVADRSFTAGSSLAVTTTKPNAGVVLRAGTYVIEYTEDA